MTHPADKAYRVPGVPPVVRTLGPAFTIPPVLRLAFGAASIAVALMWVAMSI
jgi:hypothetical protein